MCKFAEPDSARGHIAAGGSARCLPGSFAAGGSARCLPGVSPQVGLLVACPGVSPRVGLYQISCMKVPLFRLYGRSRRLLWVSI